MPSSEVDEEFNRNPERLLRVTVINLEGLDHVGGTTRCPSSDENRGGTDDDGASPPAALLLVSRARSTENMEREISGDREL